MRVTNKMMQTNMLSNINKNKLNLSDLADQYSTQQKIQKPSQDPVVAVRSLKYRTMTTEINQYVKKNIPDARSWMEQTESALDGIDSILTKINGYFTQGATDSYETSDRDALVETLNQYLEQIYDNLNADNAGRYLFSGYRTDTSYIFSSDTSNVKYDITENFSASSIESFSYVVSNVAYKEGTTADTYASSMSAEKKSGHRITLSYNDIDSISSISYTASDGTAQTVDASKIGTFDPNAADPYADLGTTYDVLVNAETGEMILSDDMYEKLSTGSNISIDYEKSSFEKGDVRPEHIVDCTAVTLDSSGKEIAGTEKNYQTPSGQSIEYEINYSQTLSVNTLGNQVMSAELANKIEDIIAQIENCQKSESKLSEVETMIDSGSYSGTDLEALEQLKEQLSDEVALQKSVLQEKFGNGLTVVKNTQNAVTKEVANLGSRVQRLDLTEDRLTSQATTVAEMLTKNDTVDIEEAIVNYNAAANTYNASLNAASKIIQYSLLDFL